MAFTRAGMFTIVLLTVAGALVAASTMHPQLSSGGVIDPFLVGGGGEDGGKVPPVKNPVPACVYDKAAQAKGKDACPGNCGPGMCCDYKLDSNGKPMTQCACHTDANPCGSDPKKCLTCMAYAEAGGKTINDACMKLAMCAAQNRVNNPAYPGVHNACEAIAQGNGQQFNSYSCVCNNQDKNQKYCKCCNGTITDPAELAEVEKARKMAANLDCSGFSATHFNNAGQNSWAKQHCTPVAQSACPTFDFYKCP